MPIYMCHARWFKQRVSCVLIKSESLVLVTEIRSICSAESEIGHDLKLTFYEWNLRVGHVINKCS